VQHQVSEGFTAETGGLHSCENRFAAGWELKAAQERGFTCTHFAVVDVETTGSARTKTASSRAQSLASTPVVGQAQVTVVNTGRSPSIM
jgi:hypothetical protein